MRGLKALAENIQTTPELEKEIETEIQRAIPLYTTAALYETFNQTEAPDWAAPFLKNTPVPDGAPVAITVYATTIGPGLEEELAEALSRGETLRSRLLTVIGEEAAEQTTAFVSRLLSEEAREERSEFSPRVDTRDASLRRSIFSFLSADKIQIQTDTHGHLSPRFTRAGHILWWPPTKK
jgi:hypothetical protein